jgi:polyphosphate glucokinase
MNNSKSTFPVKVLTIDIGGTNVKVLATSHEGRRKFPSGVTLTPDRMVTEVRKLVTDWQYNVVTIGYPGLVLDGQPAREPHNLGPGWVGFDFARAFGCPVKIINDAAMQALGTYNCGIMLYLGLGTGLGSALIVDGGIVLPIELGHLSYRKGTFEDYVGLRGLKRLGKKKWRKHVNFGIARLIEAIHPDDVVLGGGNAKLLKELPPGCRAGDNAYAFAGGFRLWEYPGESRIRPKPLQQVNRKIEEMGEAKSWRQPA